MLGATRRGAGWDDGQVYIANHFAMTPDEIDALLCSEGAADLVTAHESGLVATYLPFVHDAGIGEHGALLTHVARNNSQAREPVIGEALVILHGADHYVSPRWSATFDRTGQVVPTWNYLTVHAYGTLTVHDDPAWTESVVRRTTELHERDYSVDDVPADYVERMLRAVVGIEVRLSRVLAKAKMGQNKSPEDIQGIVAGLRRHGGGDDAVATADWMEQHSLPAAQRRADLLADLRRESRPRSS